MKNFYFLLLGLFLFAQNSSQLNAQCLAPAMTFSSSSASASTLTVNFAVVPGAGWYEFQYKQSSSGTWLSGGTLGATATSKTFSGLVASTSYDVRGRSMCSGGTAGVWSTIFTASTTAPAPCEFPAVLTSTTITNSSATFTWPSIPGAGWYEFRYKLTSSGTWTSGGTIAGSGSVRVINGLASYSNYEIQTRTFCSVGGGSSAWSSSTFFTTTVNPPTLVASTINANNATVSWTAIPNAGWYEFRIKPSTGPWVSAGTLTGSATSRIFTGLAANTLYSVEARTFGPGSIASPWSPVLNFTTVTPVDCQVPPSIAASSINGNNIVISWPSVNLAAWYEFEYKTNASSTWTSGGTLGASATSKTFSGLTGNTLYNIRARTYCSDGIPSSWQTINVTTTAQSGCELPPVLSLDSVNSTVAYISWPSISNAAWYEFRYKESSSQTWITAGTLVGIATQKVLSNLNAGVTYDFQARTFCSSQVPSNWSTSVQFSTGSQNISPEHDVTVMSNNLMEKYNTINRDHPIKAYPNPTTDFVTISYQLTESNSSVKIRLVDLMGRTIQVAETTGQEGENLYKLDLINVLPGVYSLEYYVNDSFVQRMNIRKN